MSSQADRAPRRLIRAYDRTPQKWESYDTDPFDPSDISRSSPTRAPRTVAVPRARKILVSIGFGLGKIGDGEEDSGNCEKQPVRDFHTVRIFPGPHEVDDEVAEEEGIEDDIGPGNDMVIERHFRKRPVGSFLPDETRSDNPEPPVDLEGSQYAADGHPFDFFESEDDEVKYQVDDYRDPAVHEPERRVLQPVENPESGNPEHRHVEQEKRVDEGFGEGLG